jgi:small subunit ribosomal protein S8
MNINYPVGDFLIRLKNARMARLKSVTVPSTKLIKATADALAASGFLRDVALTDGTLEVGLVYRKKEPVIMDVTLVSKPGLRIYMNVDQLEKRRKPSILILSTPKGVMSSKKALKERVGGEVIAEVL